MKKVTKITKLTPEQEAQIPGWVEKYVNIGLSCEPADWARAEAAVLRAYALIGKARPRILRARSPQEAHILGTAAVLGCQPKDVSKEDLRAGANNYRGGQFWSSWVATISFFRDVCNLESPVFEQFSIEEDLCLSCGWVWWHDEVVVISDRMAEIHRDLQGRLHNIAGPSLSYRDGWALYHVHGTAVPGEWITTSGSLTPKIAVSWSNIEQRRAACELLGWTKIATELGAEELGRDEYGVLLRLQLPSEREPLTLVKVVCGTGREFVLAVPNTVKSAHEAVAWTYGVETEMYKPEFRT